jgi:DNA-binding Xre family transcriptional regulator
MELLASMPARFTLDFWLEQTGLSQRELAARAGVSPTIVNRMARNLAKQVSLNTLDALSAVLSDAHGKPVNPGDLIERVPEKKRRRG